MNIAHLWGRIVTNMQWTYDEIDAMELADILGLLDYWSIDPPLREVVNNYLGVELPKPGKAKALRNGAHRTPEERAREHAALAASLNARFAGRA